jgi:hypothetical protein
MRQYLHRVYRAQSLPVNRHRSPKDISREYCPRASRSLFHATKSASFRTKVYFLTLFHSIGYFWTSCACLSRNRLCFKAFSHFLWKKTPSYSPPLLPLAHALVRTPRIQRTMLPSFTSFPCVNHSFCETIFFSRARASRP